MRKRDFDTAPVWKLALSLCVPTCLSQAVNVLYAIVDRMFIGNIPVDGPAALAGVGVAAPITSLISSFAVLVGLGGAPLMAMRAGHGDMDEAEKTLGTAFGLLLMLSFILTPLFLLLKNPLLMAFGASPETFPHASSYLGWYLVGTPFALLSTGLNSYAVNQGLSRRAMVSVMAGAVLNIVLDPVFIFALGMGAKGAAIATVISQAASAALAISSLLSANASVKLRLMRPEWKTAGRIARLGFSPFIIIASDSLLMILLNSVLQRHGGPGLGDTLVTCSTIIQSFHLIVMNPLGGITAGGQGLVSWSYGAGNTKRVVSAYAHTQVLATLYCVLMTLSAQLAPGAFISLFTDDPEIAGMTASLLRLFTSMIIPLSFQYNNVDTFTALGKAGIALPLSLFRKALFTLGVVAFPVILGRAEAAFLAEPVCDVVAAVVSTTCMAVALPRVLRDRKERGLAWKAPGEA